MLTRVELRANSASTEFLALSKKLGCPSYQYWNCIWQPLRRGRVTFLSTTTSTVDWSQAGQNHNLGGVSLAFFQQASVAELSAQITYTGADHLGDLNFHIRFSNGQARAARGTKAMSWCSSFYQSLRTVLLSTPECQLMGKMGWHTLGATSAYIVGKSQFWCPPQPVLRLIHSTAFSRNI